MRLDKLLSHTGFGTRKSVKTILKAGHVQVNGTVQKDGKTQVNPEQDEVSVAGEEVVYREKVYYLLNKPAGVISATEDSQHQTVIDLIKAEDQVPDLFPVGRLDKDTTGLLLLTNDGPLAHQLLSPKKHVNKAYEAEILGMVTEADVKAFTDGILLEDGYRCLPADLTIEAVVEQHSKIRVVIQEGKYHQVKRMFAAVGKKVLTLKRISMGSLLLDETLGLGEYRNLTEEELLELVNS